MIKLFLISASLLLITEGSANKVSPVLLNLGHNTANAILTFEPDTSFSIINSFAAKSFDSRSEKITSMVEALKANADKSQKNVQTLLKSTGSNFQVIWITNQLYLKNANSSLIEELARFEQVTKISEDEIIHLDEPIVATPIPRQAATVEWGIDRIKAEGARYLLDMSFSSGINASEIRISTIDTGVRGTHQALRDNFYGTYGWYDPYGLTDFPNDQNGHGTHVTGTICGSGGIGVYPQAKWLACKGCDLASCTVASLLLCGQFITCPTLPDGSNPDCTHAPHLVSNSWGGTSGQTWFGGVIAAWHAAGIIPIFSAGNDGPACGTANSPGDLPNVISVGSTEISDTISYFSSRGPTLLDGRMKPDVSAPGTAIRSSIHLADDAYAAYSGTSMACPHVSGAVSILLAYNPNLTYDQIKEYLEAGVETASLIPDGSMCGGLADDVFPNHVFGQGRINAMQSLTRLMFLTSTPPPPSTTTTTEQIRNDQNNFGSTIRMRFEILSVCLFFMVLNFLKFY